MLIEFSTSGYADIKRNSTSNNMKTTLPLYRFSGILAIILWILPLANHLPIWQNSEHQSNPLARFILWLDGCETLSSMTPLLVASVWIALSLDYWYRNRCRHKFHWTDYLIWGVAVLTLLIYSLSLLCFTSY